MSIHCQGIAQQSTGDLKLYHGTSVIAFLKDDIGWIAADSKVVEETNGVVTGSHTVRKIKETNAIFYAFTVHPIMHFDNQLVYDAFSLMESTIKKEKDFNKAFETFNSIIVNKLNESINILQKNNHYATLEKYTKTSFLGFLMVQYQNGKPSYQIRSYKFQKNIEGYSTVIDPPLIMHGTYPILFLGSYEAAIKYIGAHPKYFVGFTQMKERLICLIAQEVAANPNYVSFPIDVVEMTYKNSKWYYDNKKCSIPE